MSAIEQPRNPRHIADRLIAQLSRKRHRSDVLNPCRRRGICAIVVPELREGVIDTITKLDAGVAIGGVGLLIALVQVVLGVRRERFENTFRIISRLQEPTMLITRNRAADIMSAARASNYDFHKLSPEDRAELSGLANLFGLTGLMARRHMLQRDIILAGWCRHIIATYERLEPYFTWRRTLPGGDSLRTHFEWLAGQARRHTRRDRHYRNNAAAYPDTFHHD